MEEIGVHLLSRITIDPNPPALSDLLDLFVCSLR